MIGSYRKTPRSLAELPSFAARSQDPGGQCRGVRESHGAGGRSGGITDIFECYHGEMTIFLGGNFMGIFVEMEISPDLVRFYWELAKVANVTFSSCWVDDRYIVNGWSTTFVFF